MCNGVTTLLSLYINPDRVHTVIINETATLNKKKMKFSLVLIATAAADLIGYNRGMNTAFQHTRNQRNNASNDNRLQLVKYLIHLGRMEEARQLIVERSASHKRYTRRLK